MWRFVAGGIAALLIAAAGMMVFSGRAEQDKVLPAMPKAAPAEGVEPLPDAVPEASERTREEKRFDRYDKDRDGTITRAEYLAPRRKAYAKLDSNGDGMLSFEEWAVRTTRKFAGADADRSGGMSRREFATTAVKRSPTRPRCVCPPRGDDAD